MGSGDAIIYVRRHQQVCHDVNGRGEKLPNELWFGTAATPDHLRPFGVVRYALRSVRKHKMALKEEKCVFMGISRNFPSGTVSELLAKTRNIMEK